MSSAILYVAIVAIWIGVLVPRWLKHDNGHSGPAGLRRLSRHFGAGRADDESAPQAGFGPDGRPRCTGFVPPATPAEAADASAHAPASHSESHFSHGEKVSSVASGNKENMAELYEAAAPRSAAQSYGWSADEAARQEGLSKNTSGAGAGSSDADRDEPSWAEADEPANDSASASAAVRAPRPRGPHDPHDPLDDTERRSQIVRGRRRMLWLLLIMTAVGVGLAYLQLAAWWVMIPPFVLLAGYLLLLREAAHADAEARERRDQARATARPQPARASAAPAHSAATPAPASAPVSAEGPATSEETGPRADIINLSEHVGDQLYDQYADAKLRAVGD